MEQKINEIEGLSAKTKNVLARSHIYTVAQLDELSIGELYQLKGVGASVMRELSRALNRPGLTPKSGKEVPTEEEEQITLFKWAELNEKKYPALKLMFHIPNEGKRSYVSGKRMKLAGMRKGVSDIFLSAPRGKYHGLYIEMKRIIDGKVSDDQTEWLDAVRAEGYAGYVAYGWQDASKKILRYLNGG